MAFTLEDFLNQDNNNITFGIEGLKIMFYGKNTLGKTPQSCNFPKPCLLMGESGGSALNVPKYAMNKKKDFTQIVNFLTDEKTRDKCKEKFQTIILDCVEDIIELFETAICQEFGARDVGEIQQLQKGNPNGYTVYRREFKQYINKLTSNGYTVIFLAHEETVEVKRFNDEGEGYMVDYIQPKKSKGDNSSSRFVRDLCDFRFYIKSNGINQKTKKTIMSTAWCVETDEFYAGSRFPVQSFVNPFTAENIIKAIEDAQRKASEEQGCGLEEFKLDTSDYTKEDYFGIIRPYMVKLNGLYPELVNEIVGSQLGYDEEGKPVRVTLATNDQLTELETIYNKLDALACDRGIVVDK